MMENPFLKRATEHLRDEEAFLSVVSPEPVKFHLERFGKDGSLYDRLVILQGTPGSGKTTLARLFEYPTVKALLRNTTIDSHKLLLTTLAATGLIEGSKPIFLGTRLSMETDYREFWEFPYPDELKTGLLTSMLQARAVLGWARHIGSGGEANISVHIIPREGSEAAAESIGAMSIESLTCRAREVESSVYKIIGALIPPEIDALEPSTTSAYRPFDVIDGFRIQTLHGSSFLRPLVILDDAHILHPEQFSRLQRWLVRRELRVSRWIVTRLDVLLPREALAAASASDNGTNDLPGITASRDFVRISLQEGKRERKNFRKVARDMAKRYLQHMPILRQRNITGLNDLLANQVGELGSTAMKELRDAVARDIKKADLSKSCVDEVSSLVREYLSQKSGNSSEIRLAMTRILIHRFVKRTPQRDLFESPEDRVPSRPLKADLDVFEAARLHLHHEFGTPFYFGIDNLCDASSENAEQFLHLAAEMVEASVNQVVRKKPPIVTAELQSRLLRERASSILATWDFPSHIQVRELTERMAKACLKKSLEPNASLGPGANAFGIPQTEFDELSTNHRELANVLKYAVAYNAVSIVPNYSTKHKEWCLIELGGIVLLSHGLTLKRGGFLESSTSELANMIGSDRNV